MLPKPGIFVALFAPDPDPVHHFGSPVSLHIPCQITSLIVVSPFVSKTESAGLIPMSKMRLVTPENRVPMVLTSMSRLSGGRKLALKKLWRVSRMAFGRTAGQGNCVVLWVVDVDVKWADGASFPVARRVCR